MKRSARKRQVDCYNDSSKTNILTGAAIVCSIVEDISDDDVPARITAIPPNMDILQTIGTLENKLNHERYLRQLESDFSQCHCGLNNYLQQ